MLLYPDGVLNDYDTMENAMRIVPRENDMLVLQWKDDLLETLFFKSQFDGLYETGSREIDNAHTRELRAHVEKGRQPDGIPPLVSNGNGAMMGISFEVLPGALSVVRSLPAASCSSPW